MNVILTKTLSIYTYDKTTIILRSGTTVLLDITHLIARSPQGYLFDIDPSEYAIMN